MRLAFKKIDPRAVIPAYAHEGDSGMDIRALDSGTVVGRESLLVRTGICASIPEGYELQVRPRSGISSRLGLSAVIGTVDSNYTGEIKVLLFNMSPFSVGFCEGDRIAQLVLAPVARAEIVEVDEIMDDERRGDAGFGSTGVK